MKQSEPCSESQRRCWALSSRKEIDRLSGQLALFKTKLCILWEWNLANTINVFFFFFSFYTVILFLNVLILNLDQMEFCLWWWILLLFYSNFHFNYWHYFYGNMGWGQWPQGNFIVHVVRGTVDPWCLSLLIMVREKLVEVGSRLLILIII